MGGWDFWVDRGGTFTDVIARSPSGRLVTRKLLSRAPGRYEDAVATAVTGILGSSPERGPVREIRVGTTVATNALLERAGAPTVLVTTHGFRDALTIGYQNRPDIFALDIRRPAPLHGPVVEARERLAADGTVLEQLDEDALRAELEPLVSAGYEAVAICLLHGYRFPEHELRAGHLASALGFRQVSLSHEVSPLIRLVSRGDTTVLDAYLSPVLHDYVTSLESELSRANILPERLLFMQSNGGLVRRDFFRGKDSILSGPAGGVVGMAGALTALGHRRLIGFDMGGTSTDVSLFEDHFEVVNQSEISGVRLNAPMLRVHTIAAGGGSLLRYADGRFQVGPDSAGADPGPVCYRRGGPLALTDANLMLGKLRPELFPAVLGDGTEPLDAAAVTASFRELADRVSAANERRLAPEEVAEGFVRVAVDNMANAIRQVSIRRGLDPADFVLCCFGGAGGQHACLVADALGMRTIIVHPLASLLSAYGIGLAPLRAYRQLPVREALSAAGLARWAPRLEAGAAAARAELLAQGADPATLETATWLWVRSAGGDTPIELALDRADRLAAEFSLRHRQRYGFAPQSDRLLVDSARVEAVSRTPVSPADALEREPGPDPVGLAGRTRFFSAGRWHDAPVRGRTSLSAGERIAGPALVADPHSMTVVEPGWELEVGQSGELILTRTQQTAAHGPGSVDHHAVLLEIFNNHFVGIAEEMGIVLQSTAFSVNIRERLDFSCAVFDAGGGLVANAPHIPVHLGSMGASVRWLLRRVGSHWGPGDVYVLNSPYAGGTHLPDITVVTPVFAATGAELLFILANRAHHADVGGIAPGSMPADSRDIREEGALIAELRLVANGEFQEQSIRAALTAGDYPARDPERNIADLKAQVAANAHGILQLRRLIERTGLDIVQAYMGHVQDNAEEAMREVLAQLRDGELSCTLDGGEALTVRIRVDRAAREALVDFTGSAAQVSGNLNAPAAVTAAAVLYVFRCLVRRPIPLNAGCLRPIRICLPEDSILNARFPAAVVAGNVETSQAVTNLLLGALGACAGSQGTMNNLAFGTAEFQYYETICGGSGAGPGFAGTSAVHTHMTNSRITDPEILEVTFPVRVREFGVRHGSGGAGRWRGGDGARRVLEFVAPATLTLLSSHRREGPFGLAGGLPGAPGRNFRRHADGRLEPLPGTVTTPVAAGDLVIVETPGGGGYGPPPGSDHGRGR